MPGCRPNSKTIAIAHFLRDMKIPSVALSLWSESELQRVAYRIHYGASQYLAGMTIVNALFKVHKIKDKDGVDRVYCVRLR